MLVLSRKVEEEIVITDNITGSKVVVKVTKIKGDRGCKKVLLGIAADSQYTVHRREVLDAIEREKYTIKDMESFRKSVDGEFIEGEDNI